MRVHKILVVLTIFALVLGSASAADAKKKRKKKKNSVPTTLVIESARASNIAGTVESSKAGCVDGRKVEVSLNGSPVGAIDADSEGQWFIEGVRDIGNGDVVRAEVEKVTITSKKKKITCGSDSDRFVVGSGTNGGTNNGGNNGGGATETLRVTVTGPGTVTSNPPGINCRQSAGTCERDFGTDQTVSLTASPDANATFTGWSGSCSGTSQPCNVAMTTDRTVGATFAASGTPAPACSIPDSVPEPLRGVLCTVVELLGG